MIKFVSLLQHNPIHTEQICMGDGNFIFDGNIMKDPESKSTIISEPLNSENFQVELTSLSGRFHKANFTIALS